MAKTNNEKLFETTFGSYFSEEVLGEGGAGRVYRVRDESGTRYALKLLHGHGVTADKRRRFKNEIGFLQNTSHDNLVRVVDHGVLSNAGDKSPFYVMELYDESLRTQMQRGIPYDRVLSLYSQILDGVEAAHLKNVVHRDLKPENVLHRPATMHLVVADFGVARFSAEDLLTAVETKPDTRLANFLYAAPEQRVRGQEVGVPADIYALGLMLNEMFTQHVPHGTGYRKIAHVAEGFAWLDDIVESMLRQDPTARPASIDVLKREIQLRHADAVSRQRLSRIDQTVVRESDVDDLILRDGLKVVDATWDNGTLRLRLSQPVNPKWVMALNNMGSYSSVSGKGPEMFGFAGDVASIGVQEDGIEGVIGHFKRWLPMATRVYEQMLKADAQKKAAKERAELQQQRKAEEEQIRVREKLRGLLNS
jgi:serine/threonine protein kinase